jgi:hypothetical protein
MSDLTAIDVLVDPDEATMERTRAVNARILQSLPQMKELGPRQGLATRRHMSFYN